MSLQGCSNITNSLFKLQKSKTNIAKRRGWCQYRLLGVGTKPVLVTLAITQQNDYLWPNNNIWSSPSIAKDPKFFPCLLHRVSERCQISEFSGSIIFYRLLIEDHLWGGYFVGTLCCSATCSSLNNDFTKTNLLFSEIKDWRIQSNGFIRAILLWYLTKFKQTRNAQKLFDEMSKRAPLNLFMLELSSMDWKIRSGNACLSLLLWMGMCMQRSGRR